MQDIFNWIASNYIELLAALSGIAGVWLTTRQRIWCWPIALISVILYIYIFYASKLYADFGLQIFYLGMTLYGWNNWLHGGENREKLSAVNGISKKTFLLSLIIGIGLQTVLGYFLANYTDAVLPYLDSVVGVWGVIITYWMARKILENWLAWIVIDLMAIGIFAYKELYLTAGLYFIYAILAFIGYLQWRKDMIKT